MGFLKSIGRMLFGGSQSNQKGLYFYVRLYKLPNRQSPDDEIVEVRLHSYNDLSLNDDGDYFIRKVVVGPNSFRRAELMLTFNKGRTLIEAKVEGGELVEQEDYLDYVDKIGENDG